MNEAERIEEFDIHKQKLEEMFLQYMQTNDCLEMYAQLLFNTKQLLSLAASCGQYPSAIPKEQDFFDKFSVWLNSMWKAFENMVEAWRVNRSQIMEAAIKGQSHVIYMLLLEENRKLKKLVKGDTNES